MDRVLVEVVVVAVVAVAVVVVAEEVKDMAEEDLLNPARQPLHSSTSPLWSTTLNSVSKRCKKHWNRLRRGCYRKK